MIEERGSNNIWWRERINVVKEGDLINYCRERGSVSNHCSERGIINNWNGDMIVNENEESIVKEMKNKTVFKYNEGRLRMKSGYKIVTSILFSAIL